MLSVPVNVKVAARLLDGFAGLSAISVFGGLVSIPLKVCTAGVGSTLPARSTARTSKLYMPSSVSGCSQPLWQETNSSSSSTGSQGATTSGASVRSCSTSRHS